MEEDKENLLSVLFEQTDALRAEMPSAELTEKVIGCAYKVSNSLGCGFLEKVYENALAHELRKAGFEVIQQQRVNVFYDGISVGYYDADIVVNGCLIIEVKALRALDDAHKAQTLNYLKATGIKLGLLINFGVPRVEVKRVAL
jgi:GxxExxY protein